MTVNVHLTSSDWKEKAGGIKQRGKCWKPIEPLLEATSMSEISEELRQQNGFYALVWEKNDQLIAAVDHIRSIPLFYALKDGEFYLSDDAEWVREQVDNKVMDLFAKEEFQLTGYVTGRDTLYPDVKQLQAGEFLLYKKNIIKSKFYYDLQHVEPKDFDANDLLLKLDIAAKKSIKNLIDYADGRQIVIPLSGGYDSRLIASLIKESGYQSVIAFTYGAKGNKEAKYSKIVADSLGIDWHFVEYKESIWKEKWNTDERKRYQLVSTNWSSLGHMQDWLAVCLMKEQGVVDDNAIFVPGHTGDFISGGHIPKCFHDGLEINVSGLDVVNEIFVKHYCLADIGSFETKKERFFNKINDEVRSCVVFDKATAANAFEYWEWKERQAKFIFNSVRVYEFFGYDWWVPLWDRDFITFFEGLPLSMRNHDWYIDYVKDKYNKNVIDDSVRSGLNNASDPNLAIKVSKLNIVEKIKIKKIAASIYKFFFLRKTKNSLRLSVYPKKELLVQESKGTNPVGISSYFFIKEFGS